MEEKKVKKISLSTFFLILAIITICIMCFFLYNSTLKTNDMISNEKELNAKIAELENKIRYAKIIDESEIDTKTVQVGNTVKVLDMEFNEEESYTIVGSTEVDLSQNKISNESPIGSALMGAKKGQIVEAQAPVGVIKYKIISITK